MTSNIRSRRKTISWSVAFTSINKMWLHLKHNQDLFWGAKNWVCWKQDPDSPVCRHNNGDPQLSMHVTDNTAVITIWWHLLEQSITMTQWVPFWWTNTHEWHCLYIYNLNYNLHNYFVLPSFVQSSGRHWVPPVYIRFHQNGYLWLSESASIIYILMHNVKNSFVLVKGTTVIAKQ